MSQIVRLINRLKIEDQVKQDAVAVYKLIAKAEGKAHGQRMDEIHFHEVGTMDAVADVVAVCYLLNELQVDQILASPVRVGYGHVKCAHGILPVPAPATAYLMKEIPMYAGDLEGEFCTPTGAALLKHFVKKYEQMPVLQMEEIGYDDYFFGNGVCMIEWAELIEELIPENSIHVTIEKDLEKGFDYRRITITGLEGWENK